MSINGSPSDGDPVADSSPIGWVAVDSGHSTEKAETDEAGGAIQAPAERELRAVYPQNLRREAEKKWVEEKQREKELSKRLAEVHRGV